MSKFICIKEYETKYRTFHIDDEIEPTIVNDNWWIVDSVGIPNEILKSNFKQIENGSLGKNGNN